MELLADRDPEEARKLLDPVLEHMMEAVHRYEGTVNQVMGDGIMALFGAPLAYEDHAVRACYAALAMQSAIRRYTEQVRGSHGIEVEIRVGLNSGEVVVRAIGGDLRMDYTAVGQTTHLAARMEQLAPPGGIWLTAQTLNLAEGRGLELGKVTSMLFWFPQIASALGSAYALSGRVREALPLLEQAVEGRRVAQAPRVANLSEGYLLVGRMEDASQSTQRALALSRDHKERGNEAWVLRLLGEIASHQDPAEVDKAEAYYHQAMVLVEELGMRPLMARCHLGLGSLYRRIGNLQQARKHLVTATTMMRDMEMGLWLEKAEAELKELV